MLGHAFQARDGIDDGGLREHPCYYFGGIGEGAGSEGDDAVWLKRSGMSGAGDDLVPFCMGREACTCTDDGEV